MRELAFGRPSDAQLPRGRSAAPVVRDFLGSVRRKYRQHVLDERHIERVLRSSASSPISGMMRSVTIKSIGCSFCSNKRSISCRSAAPADLLADFACAQTADRSPGCIAVLVLGRLTMTIERLRDARMDVGAKTGQKSGTSRPLRETQGKVRCPRGKPCEGFKSHKEGSKI